MARVAREVVQKTGIDVDKLLEMLLRNASAELTTFYYYTILRVNLIGLEGEGGTKGFGGDEVACGKCVWRGESGEELGDFRFVRIADNPSDTGKGGDDA